jgi:hypothetical protein
VAGTLPAARAYFQEVEANGVAVNDITTDNGHRKKIQPVSGKGFPEITRTTQMALRASFGCVQPKQLVLNGGSGLSALRFPLSATCEEPAVEETDLQNEISKLKDKLNRAMRRTEGLREKSKLLEMNYTDAKERETRSTELVMELIERQRELNVMLNRANIMLNRTQETLALTSSEFNEIVKALPEPKKAEWSDRVARVNDLFKKAGFQEAETSEIENTATDGPAFDTGELKQESKEAFGRTESAWGRRKEEQPSEKVEAVLIEDEIIHSSDVFEDSDAADDEHCASENDSLLRSRRKSWWKVRM